MSTQHIPQPSLVPVSRDGQIASLSTPPAPAAGSDLLALRWAGLRRDLQMIVDGVRGVPQPTFSVRRPRRSDQQRQAAAPSAPVSPGGLDVLKPRPMVIRQVLRETASAVTLVLADPTLAPIAFSAGQFFTLLLPCDPAGGPPLRRAYSACSSPLDDDGRPATTVAITCKRVAGGIVSNYLNDRAAAGDVLSVLGPSGHFTPQPSADKRRHLVLIGGGSGITPLLSIVRATLQSEPASRITLIYGNRCAADILFHATLEQLAQQHPDRLALRLVLDDPPAGWGGGQGLLDARNLQSELRALSLLPGSGGEQAALPREYYLCGPSPMMVAARQVLQDSGVADAQIWEERFASLHDPVTVGGAANTPVAMQLRLRRLADGNAAPSEQAVLVKPGETLLEAGLSAGLAMPFSCAMGGCGACRGRLTQGEVVMSEPNCLSPAERARGDVLPCIAKPCGAVHVEVES
jgi:ferredoxin-NADP reductase